MSVQKILSPRSSVVWLAAGGRRGSAIAEAFYGIYWLRGAFGTAEIFFVDHFPVVPLLYNFFTVEQHTAYENASRSTASFLTIVHRQRFSHVLWQRNVQFVFQLVYIVLSASFAQVVVQFFVICFSPPFNFLPRMRGGRWRRSTVCKTLHLNLTGRSDFFDIWDLWG